MKKNILRIAITIVTVSLLGACTTSSKSEQSSSSDVQVIKANITLTKAPASPEFPDATLSKNDVSVIANDSMNAVDYSFDVANYELGVQTKDADTLCQL